MTQKKTQSLSATRILDLTRAHKLSCDYITRAYNRLASLKPTKRHTRR